MGTITTLENGNKLIRNFDDSASNNLGPNWTKSSTAQVSDYYGYGSFSGADIKVIVHFPKSATVSTQVERRAVELEKERQIVGNDILALIADGSNPALVLSKQ